MEHCSIKLLYTPKKENVKISVTLGKGMCEPPKERGAHLPRFMRSVSENPSRQNIKLMKLEFIFGEKRERLRVPLPLFALSSANEGFNS